MPIGSDWRPALALCWSAGGKSSCMPAVQRAPMILMGDGAPNKRKDTITG
jgi:hypothetical protein